MREKINLTSKHVIGFVLFVILIGFSNCSYNNAKSSEGLSVDSSQKQRGAHVFRFRDSLRTNYYQTNNIEWITLVPWGYQDNFESSEVRHVRGDNTDLEAYNKRYVTRIQKLRADGFKVFVKPHIWLRNTPDGTWRSDVYPKSNEEWETWKEDYREFILRYAKVAEEAEAEMFCVGTELTRLSIEKAAFWKEIIKEIKEVYSGKLTYAANWYKEYDHIDFWDELDYIGVQAYFPLTNNEHPSVEELEKGWDKHLVALESVSQKFSKPILFTEIGYKSHSESGIKPWEWMNYRNIDETKFSERTQANCYKAFFNKVWVQDWFSGAHLWQFRENHRFKEVDLDFTPQGKEAEVVIKDGFSYSINKS